VSDPSHGLIGRILAMIADLVRGAKSTFKAKSCAYHFYAYALPWLADHDMDALVASGLIPELLIELQHEEQCHNAFRALSPLIDHPAFISPEIFNPLFAYATSHLHPLCPVFAEVLEFFWSGVVVQRPEVMAFVTQSLPVLQTLAETEDGAILGNVILHAVTISLGGLDEGQVNELVPALQGAIRSWPPKKASSFFESVGFNAANVGARDLLVLAHSPIAGNFVVEFGVALTKFFSLPFFFRQRLKISDEVLQGLVGMFRFVIDGGFVIERDFPEFVEWRTRETIFGTRIELVESLTST
jgi:hypothetical protein